MLLDYPGALVRRREPLCKGIYLFAFMLKRHDKRPKCNCQLQLTK